MPSTPSLNDLRQQQQLAFLAQKTELRIGHAHACPLPPEHLAELDEHASEVTAVLESGLTARVFQLKLAGADYALKKARPNCLVQNLDGQTSFLNELQRRAEIDALRQRHGGFSGIVPTLYGSLAQGIILSPWLSGGTLQDWDERKLIQLFASGAELCRHGLFEWDFCPGNLIDDGRQLWLFDFGYMYRFDPLTQFNSAGQGNDVPEHHLAERIETRAYFAWLLEQEQTRGQDAALAAFRLEKEIAIEAYRKLRLELAADGANSDVLDWLDGLGQQWRQALRGDGEALYWQEGWRSHRLDLDDDIRGQTCTPRTLARCDWMLNALQGNFDALRSSGALAHEAIRPERGALLDHYRRLRSQAEDFQIA
ncbi:hypothetical protein [Chitinimonas taiwanensis]|uniref:hypothetical protein n=1 Tax=Chitinimonas taiwanensis TaxID=240412 RepID=UPI0035B4CBBA